MVTKVKAAPSYTRPVKQTKLTPGSRINDLCVVIETFSYSTKGRKGKEIYNQFFDALIDAGIGTIVRFDKHVLNGRQRHLLFKQALIGRAQKAGMKVHVGGYRIDKDQYYLEAQLLPVD